MYLVWRGGFLQHSDELGNGFRVHDGRRSIVTCKGFKLLKRADVLNHGMQGHSDIMPKEFFTPLPICFFQFTPERAEGRQYFVKYPWFAGGWISVWPPSHHVSADYIIPAHTAGIQNEMAKNQNDPIILRNNPKWVIHCRQFNSLNQFKHWQQLQQPLLVKSAEACLLYRHHQH